MNRRTKETFFVIEIYLINTCVVDIASIIYTTMKKHKNIMAHNWEQYKRYSSSINYVCVCGVCTCVYQLWIRM
jgi:hypothetical protein